MTSSPSQTILVAGSTGYLGRHIVTELLAHGKSVRALVRNRSRASAQLPPSTPLIEGQVTIPATLSGCCNGVDCVISAVGITRQRGYTYEEVDYQGNLNLLNEAVRVGVRRFVYVSVFGAERLEHLRIVQAKRHFEQALISSPIEHVIIRPNGYFSDMGEFFEMARRGLGVVFGGGDFRLNPIHGADLAQVCADAVWGNQKQIEVGGPEVLTHRQILNLAFETLGKKSRILSLPSWLPKFLARVMHFATPLSASGPAEFTLTVLSRDMIAACYGTRHLRDWFETLKRKNVRITQ